MKIIQEGSEKQLNKIKRFECRNCGCIFEADKTEYKSENQYNETSYYCECPFCKRHTFKEIKML